MDHSADGGAMHLDDSNVVHPPIHPITKDDMVKIIIEEETALPIFASLEQAVNEAISADRAGFIKMLVDALMADDPVPQPGNHSGLGEHVCRKHGHQPWCNRMHVLAKYTRLAINYHHAKKKLRYEDYGHDPRAGFNKYMNLVCLYGELKAEARGRFYSAECDCTGLRTSDPYTDEIDHFMRVHKR